ncbi:hypothetical protein R6V09_28940 [Streptomyces sp. W16]|uniref:hypothetical protein n=1 Tax=Streptomyces sp. W16 TaxID=3076631 RepID=UPI00295ADFE0|nr:hypothetical protein [Streptomyces sp. W16]MDV9174121.1 hypothetical protein [Streptomyces sp. W16]
MTKVPSTEVQEFDLALLSLAALADDPHPDRPLRLTVLGYREDEAGDVETAVEIRTTPEQFGYLFANWRAIQLSLADRARKQALAELAEESSVDRARREALHAERAGRPDMSDLTTCMDVLERFRRGLERSLGPAPQAPLPPSEEP